MVSIPKKPKNSAEFLEVMSKIIFASGFRWDLVESKWPGIKKAFYNFNIKKVANANIEDMLKKEGMIRNRYKIMAIIENARICEDIIKKHKSISNWIKKVHKKNKKEPLFNPAVWEEMQKFSKIGNTTSRWLAYIATRDRKMLDEG